MFTFSPHPVAGVAVDRYWITLILLTHISIIIITSSHISISLLLHLIWNLQHNCYLLHFQSQKWLYNCRCLFGYFFITFWIEIYFFSKNVCSNNENMKILCFQKSIVDWPFKIKMNENYQIFILNLLFTLLFSHKKVTFGLI